MAIFEVVCKGFDGTTDATDDRILWVQAPDAAAVLVAIDGTGAILGDTVSEANDLTEEEGLDFELPEHSEFLRERCENPGARNPDGSTGYLVTYECDCGCTWEGNWSCACDDECPECGTDTEASDYRRDGTHTMTELAAFNAPARA